MIILVADTSVIIDLERGDLLQVALRGGDTIAVPDLLYDRELAAHGGPEMLQLGLQVLELTDREVVELQALKRINARLSVPDCAAYVSARRDDHHLLAGDGLLRAHAESTGVRCNGVLWLMDRLLESGATTPAILHGALTRMVGHHRCRLPYPEVKRRLEAWKE